MSHEPDPLPTEQELGERARETPRHPGATGADAHKRFAEAVAAVFAGSLKAPQEWLDRACAALLEFVSGEAPAPRPARPGLGVWGVIHERHDPAGETRTRAASAVGYRDARQAAAMWTHVSLGLREDDMPAPSGDQPVRTGAQAAASGTWGRSSYARFRDRHGLGGFVRLRQEQGFERSQLTLTMQVDWPVSAASADGPDADLTHRLGLLATIMGYALLHGVLEHEARRAGIMGRLSAAQRQVLPHVLEGLSEREVAAKLRRSPHTVHDHVKAIYAALGIASRHQLRDLWNGMSSPAGTPEPEGGTGAERARTIGADES